MFCLLHINYVMQAYCGGKYKKNRKKWSAKTKFRVAVFSLIFILILLVVYYFNVVCPIVVSISQDKIRSISTKVISQSIGDTIINQNLSYDDFVSITYSSDNKIKLIEVDSVKVNLLIREVTKEVQRHFDNLSNEGIEIALGTFTGFPFLYGMGPNISVQLVPVGSINTDIQSTFSSAGINQTIHRLYFVISASVGMVLPANTQNIETQMEVVLCESILVGDIPNIYLQGSMI